MKRNIATLVLACLLAFSFTTAQPAAAQGEGCRAFGDNIAFLATELGPVFGQTAAAGAPLNDTVEIEQDRLCI